MVVPISPVAASFSGYDLESTILMLLSPSGFLRHHVEVALQFGAC